MPFSREKQERKGGAAILPEQVPGLRLVLDSLVQDRLQPKQSALSDSVLALLSANVILPIDYENLVDVLGKSERKLDEAYAVLKKSEFKSVQQFWDTLDALAQIVNGTADLVDSFSAYVLTDEYKKVADNYCKKGALNDCEKKGCSRKERLRFWQRFQRRPDLNKCVIGEEANCECRFVPPSTSTYEQIQKLQNRANI